MTENQKFLARAIRNLFHDFVKDMGLGPEKRHDIMILELLSKVIEESEAANTKKT